jgi:hypothetical protein
VAAHKLLLETISFSSNLPSLSALLPMSCLQDVPWLGYRWRAAAGLAAHKLLLKTISLSSNLPLLSALLPMSCLQELYWLGYR